MRRESHVRFCEGGGVRFPSATRRIDGLHFANDTAESAAMASLHWEWGAVSGAAGGETAPRLYTRLYVEFGRPSCWLRSKRCEMHQFALGAA